jgi:hypothetical protein
MDLTVEGYGLLVKLGETGIYCHGFTFLFGFTDFLFCLLFTFYSFPLSLLQPYEELEPETALLTQAVGIVAGHALSLVGTDLEGIGYPGAIETGLGYVNTHTGPGEEILVLSAGARDRSGPRTAVELDPASVKKPYKLGRGPGGQEGDVVTASTVVAWPSSAGASPTG